MLNQSKLFSKQFNKSTTCLPAKAGSTNQQINKKMVKFPDTDLDNIVELRGINQSYDGGKSYIIKDLDFLVENKPDRGQFICILGMSGSGKSTLLRYIAGLQEPTAAGTILVNQKPLSKDNRVSMVFQQYSSLPWMSVLDLSLIHI